MNSVSRIKRGVFACLVAAGIVGAVSGCGSSDDGETPAELPVGPANAGTPPAHTLGNAANGRTVFRFETFGNERFWTDAVRLPQGMVAAGVTPLQALRLGLHIDIDSVPAAMRQALMTELQADPTGTSSPTLNNAANTVALINANAVIGYLPGRQPGGTAADAHAAAESDRRYARKYL